MIVTCPACGRGVDTEDCVYTTIDTLDTHPRLMRYVPNCECSHQLIENPDLMMHPTNIPDAMFGGIEVFSINKHKKRTN
jgi:hypothetical protein